MIKRDQCSVKLEGDYSTKKFVNDMEESLRRSNESLGRILKDNPLCDTSREVK